ncbi:MAG: FliI/YscN family ATPase [Deltaproteobacteria bacterium]|nr:FliI/YscN family ATPase [Deltaproteobacteria bacterium]
METGNALNLNMTPWLRCQLNIKPWEISGRVESITGSSIRARIGNVALGEMVHILTSRVEAGANESLESTQKSVRAFVSATTNDTAMLSTLENANGIKPGDAVISRRESLSISASPALLGSVVDSLGNATYRHSNIGDSPRFYHCKNAMLPISNSPTDAMSRKSIRERFVTGIRAIDAFIPIGQGQRLAVFAEPGVGKSTLAAMIAKNSSADVNVIALIGERGREVRELLLDTLEPETFRRTVAVVSTSDESAISRVNAALVATTIAEYFSNYGFNVLLQIDSLTRLFRAYREVGLAAGEVPVRRGYPPSVFAALPRLIERAGPGRIGSITALYTVLLSSDMDEDPMVEEVKSLTDGHIVLTRQLAEQGHYPAIDVLGSISRLQNKLLSDELLQITSTLRRTLAIAKRDRDLAMFGENIDPELSRILEMAERINKTLRQATNDVVTLEDTEHSMRELLTSHH